MYTDVWAGRWAVDGEGWGRGGMAALMLITAVTIVLINKREPALGARS